MINKTSAGAITFSRRRRGLPQPRAAAAASDFADHRRRRRQDLQHSYNSVVGLNDGNDFVLQAAAAVRVWDGDVPASPPPNDQWSNPVQLGRRRRPASTGDILVFNDVGVLNGPTLNDFVGYNFGSISIANTVGSYDLQAAVDPTTNAITLNFAGGGIVDTSAQNNAVSLDLSIATNPQAISNTAGGTLTQNGEISLATGLSVTGTSNVAFASSATIDGAQALTVNSSGDVSFAGAIGGGTPLAAVAVTTVDDLSFAAVTTTGNVTQSAGTGTTTLTGPVSGAAINVTTANIALTTAVADVTASAGNPINLTASQTLSLAAGASLATTNTAIGLVARDVTIDAAASIAAGAAAVSLRPFTAGDAIDLGPALDPVNTTLELSDAELDTISAATINLGDASTGAVSVTAAINRAVATNLNVTGTSIAFSGGSLDAGGGDVTLSTPGGVSADAAGTDVFANLVSITAGVLGIGSGANPLRMAATTLVTDTNDAADGSQFLAEADSVSIGAADLDAGAAIVTLSGGSFLTTLAGSILSNTVVGSGATLGGDGVVVGTVQVNSGGTINPGTSPGILTTTGSATFASGSTYAVEINGLTPGTQHDQLAVSGTVSLGNATLTLSGTYSAPPSPPLESITIIDNDGSLDTVAGIFNGLPEGAAIAAPGGGTLFITYQGGDGNDVVLNSQPVVSGGAGPDTLIFRQVSGLPNNFEFSLNGGPFINVGAITSFTFDGLGSDDILTVDFVNGDAIPGTGLAGEGIFYNGNTHDFISAPPPANGDLLQVLGTGTQNATYTPDGVVGPLDNDGTVSVVGSGVITFTGLEPLDMVSMAVANVSFPNADDDFSLVDGVTFGGGALSAIVVSGVSGGVGFEAIALRDNGLVNIDTIAIGGDGADTITITSAASAHLNASLTINSGAGGDTITIDGLLVFSGTVTLDSQQINFNTATAQVMAATVVLDAGTGSVSGGNPSLDVVATTLTATADDGVNLDTTVSDLTATITSVGNILIDETDGLSDLNLNAGSGTVTLSAGGTVVDTAADGNDLVGSAVTVDVNGGDFGQLANPIETTPTVSPRYHDQQYQPVHHRGQRPDRAGPPCRRRQRDAGAYAWRCRRCRCCQRYYRRHRGGHARRRGGRELRLGRQSDPDERERPVDLYGGGRRRPVCHGGQWPRRPEPERGCREYQPDAPGRRNRRYRSGRERPQRREPAAEGSRRHGRGNQPARERGQHGRHREQHERRHLRRGHGRRPGPARLGSRRRPPGRQRRGWRRLHSSLQPAHPQQQCDHQRRHDLHGSRLGRPRRQSDGRSGNHRPGHDRSAHAERGG